MNESAGKILTRVGQALGLRTSAEGVRAQLAPRLPKQLGVPTS